MRCYRAGEFLLQQSRGFAAMSNRFYRSRIPGSLRTVSVSGVHRDRLGGNRGGVGRRRCVLHGSGKSCFNGDSILRSCGSTTVPLPRKIFPNINGFLSDSSSSFSVPYSRSKPVTLLFATTTRTITRFFLFILHFFGLTRIVILIGLGCRWAVVVFDIIE